MLLPSGSGSASPEIFEEVESSAVDPAEAAPHSSQAEIWEDKSIIDIPAIG